MAEATVLFVVGIVVLTVKVLPNRCKASKEEEEDLKHTHQTDTDCRFTAELSRCSEINPAVMISTAPKSGDTRFQIGNAVRVKDKWDSEWQDGIVHSVDPLRVKMKMGGRDFSWDQVKPDLDAKED